MTFRPDGARQGPRRWWTGALCLALTLASPATTLHAGANPDALAALQRGLKALDRQDPRTARVELMNAIKADPSLAAARIAQARALLMLGNGIAAQDELDRAVALGARAGSIRPLLAHAALLQGKPEHAVRQAEADDIAPREAVFAARIAGQAHEALGQYDAAARAFGRALAVAPGDAALWADIARFRLATGDMAAALAAADRAVALAPRSVDTLVLRGMLVREQYGLMASLPWFERALDVSPSDVPAMIEYAATLADAGQARRALALSRRALSLAPGLPRAYFLQAVMAARAGQYDLARTLLVHTHGALDGRAATRLLRGVLHLQSGNATLAIEQLRPLLEAQPLNMRARLLLANASYRAGQYDDAERILFPLVERADADSYALTLAARIHEALGHVPLAQEFLSRANAPAHGGADVFRGAGEPQEAAGDALANPADAYANLRYIRALLEAGDAVAALARAQGLRAINPGAPAAHMAEGDCLAALGRYGEAARAYARSANLRFSEDIALRLVDAWRRAGEPDQARQALALYLAQNPMSIDVTRLTASLWLAAGQYGRALAMLEAVRARLGNEDTQLMADLARAALGAGDKAGALAYAAHAYRLQPASPVAADIFGWTLFSARGASQTSLDLLEKAADLAPREPLVRLHLGQVYAALGHKDRARAELQLAASQTFPQRAEAIKALSRL